MTPVVRHRVLCFGGRRYFDRSAIDAALALLRETLGDFAVIHGGAQGADTLCGAWGKARGLPVIRVDANWDVYLKRAGGIRNSWMLEICAPSYAVEFPGGTGTADMKTKLLAAGVPVWTPYPANAALDGLVTSEVT